MKKMKYVIFPEIRNIVQTKQTLFQILGNIEGLSDP